MRRIPVVLALTYLAIYAGVLVKNIYWPVGDQTDVIRAGIAAFPIGLLLSFFYPGGSYGAFFVVTLAAILNAVLIFYASRRVIRRFNISN